MAQALDHTQIVRDYLAACEARDFETARAFLGQRVEMVFPGGRRPADPTESAANSALRYRRVAKTIEGFDVAPSADGVVVYCYGTLHGEWPDGRAFSGIRFVDRFLLIDNRIVKQWVWNDTAEALRAATEAA